MGHNLNSPSYQGLADAICTEIAKREEEYVALQTERDNLRAELEQLKTKRAAVVWRKMLPNDFTRFRRECPFCGHGLFLMARGEDNMLQADDGCINCGIKVTYTDIEYVRKVDSGEEAFPTPPTTQFVDVHDRLAAAEAKLVAMAADGARQHGLFYDESAKAAQLEDERNRLLAELEQEREAHRNTQALLGQADMALRCYRNDQFGMDVERGQHATMRAVAKEHKARADSAEAKLALACKELRGVLNDALRSDMGGQRLRQHLRTRLEEILTSIENEEKK